MTWRWKKMPRMSLHEGEQERILLETCDGWKFNPTKDEVIWSEKEVDA